MSLFLLFALASLTPVDEAGYRKLVAEHKGNVVVVNFWATWCGPCKEEMPALLSFSKKYAAKKVRLVLVSADEPENEPAARRFLQSVGADGKQYLKSASDDDKFINAINPKWSGALPATFVYGQDGKLLKSFFGKVAIPDLEKAAADK